MRRDLLASLGIQLPVLPTIVLGGLPGPPDWAPTLERIGLDVISSGADPDTPLTFGAVLGAVPHRPCKAVGGATEALLAELTLPIAGGDGRYVMDPGECVRITPHLGLADANQIAAFVLAEVREGPSEWWVAAAGLGQASPVAAETLLENLVEATRHVRLFLAKQQFD